MNDLNFQNKSLKIAFVIPRYHVSQAGGAEILVESLALRLAGLGHSVDVLTTCCVDHTRWENDLPPKVENIQGVKVHRFKVDLRGDLSQFIRLQQRIDQGWPLSRQEEEVWMKGSVHSQALYESLRLQKDIWDAVVFAPYLFGITYEGLKIVPQKSFLIPCLHPEPYAHLGIFKDMFQKPIGFFFNSYAEMELGKKLFLLADKKMAVVGMGFDKQEVIQKGCFREKFSLGDNPFILYVGRREKGKNTFLLIDYFLTYRKYNPGPLKLVLLGSGEIPRELKNNPDLIDIGYVSEEEKRMAYQGATVVCQPSINESFSIVLMESWLSGTPVLVNEKCAVTKDHVQKSQGGLWFRDYFEFEECVRFFMNGNSLVSQMGLSGKEYVLENFKWDQVLNRFLKVLLP